LAEGGGLGGEGLAGEGVFIIEWARIFLLLRKHQTVKKAQVSTT